ncbi:MAG: alpha-L-rhamnosidase [Leeuwenhoekiella sp.]
MKKAHLALVFFMLLILQSCKQQNGLSVSKELRFKILTVNSKENPTAIETEQPLFSWIVDSDGYDKSQSSYHILVASSVEKLNESDADVWNSKSVESNYSSFVKYKGSPLEAMKTYYWKVKIRDEANVASSWSKTQKFRMGLINETNWGASKWITLKKDTRTSPHRFRDYKTGKMTEPIPVKGYAASYFRNEIEISKVVKSAEAYICGLGYYDLYLNGRKVGNHVLDPAPSNYDKQAYYVNYDITEALKSGRNAFGITLGNGFYGQNISWKRDPLSNKDLAYGPPSVRLLVKLKYDDGTEADFYTDGTWKEATGPIVFNNIYGGDTYDANYELGEWTTADYDDSSWGSTKIAAPELNRISANQIPPIKKLKVFEPQKVFKGADGEWIVDFGQNIAGWVKINVNGNKNQIIEIITTEALLTNGKDIYKGSTGGGANGMPQIFKYICSGKGPESWEPKFSYHGFRYAKIKGVSRKPDADMIKAVLVATDIQEKGSFTSSDSLLNKMHSISKWTIVDNLHGIPEDCPHREKCGWLGDAHAFCEYALYNYDMYDFYKKYMEDIRTQMRSTQGHNDPEITFQVPTMIAPGKRTSTYAKLDWGVATMYLPWYNYLHYGSEDIVTEYYGDMKNLTDFYLNFKSETGIVQDGMGDWCPPLWDRRTNPEAMECDPIISANAYFYDVLGIMECFAKMNDDEAYATQMQKEKAALKKAFNKEFLVNIPNTAYKWYQSQTATVQALQFNLVPEQDIETVVNGLVYDIVEVKNGHHSTGIHGNRYIYTVLSKFGNAELAYRILTTPEFPSQNYIMNSGFTTWPERQFEWEKMEGPSNSLNHPMHSGFAAYFFESLGGIKSSVSSPGYKEFSVNPQIPGQVTSVNVKISTPYGNINNKWTNDKGKLSMTLEVPFNTKANVALDQNKMIGLTINGKPLGDFQLDPNVNDRDHLQLGSGVYIIEYYKS